MPATPRRPVRSLDNRGDPGLWSNRVAVALAPEGVEVLAFFLQKFLGVIGSSSYRCLEDIE